MYKKRMILSLLCITMHAWCFENVQTKKILRAKIPSKYHSFIITLLLSKMTNLQQAIATNKPAPDA